MCKLIKDTVDCVNLHAKCYSAAEIREDKDRHIAGRMQQFANDDTVAVRKCAVVKEYVDSGRADAKASDDEKCTKGQVRLGRGRSERWAAARDISISRRLSAMVGWGRVQNYRSQMLSYEVVWR